MLDKPLWGLQTKKKNIALVLLSKQKLYTAYLVRVVLR